MRKSEVEGYLFCGAAAAMLALALAPEAGALDAAAAEALMKKSGCTACHAVAANKVGPSYKATAVKHQGKPDAEKTLYAHVTTNPKIKIGGAEERHDSLNTKNEAEIKNVIEWILSR